MRFARALIVVIVLGVTYGAAAAQPLALTGVKLGLKDGIEAFKKKLQVESRDPTITLGGGNGSASDPVFHGGTLRLRTADGCGGPCETTYPLPAVHWAYYGSAGGNAGYKYKDSSGGVIQTAAIKPALVLKLRGRGAGLGHALPVDPRPVDVTLTLGDQAYCLTFGGTVTKMIPGKQFIARLSPAGLCPP